MKAADGNLVNNSLEWTVYHTSTLRVFGDGASKTQGSINLAENGSLSLSSTILSDFLSFVLSPPMIRSP